MTRRSLIAAGAATAVLASARDVAARELIPFGAAVMISDFRSDAMLRENLVKFCDVITPMNELKWDWVRQRREDFSLDNANEIVAFARRNNKRAHGHALLWGLALPRWAEQLSSKAEAERELTAHAQKLVTTYAGTIQSWDVVNEVIAHDPKPGAPMRDTVSQRLLGEDHVDIVFKAAASANPAAKLVLNDYDFENADERTAERRRQALRLVRRLQDKKIPVHEVGMQAHLYGEKPLDQRAITAFCRELGRLGVGVKVTELDVIDWQLPGPTAERDRRAADLTAAYLGAVIEGQRPSAIITWGLSDRSSWVHDTFKRKDSFKARPLPLDADYRPKPMMAAIQAARALPTPRS
ncbi:MAG: endo-1,4-beta-xylanase [Bosea sp. (in: a-proteobacteria)]